MIVSTYLTNITFPNPSLLYQHLFTICAAFLEHHSLSDFVAQTHLIHLAVLPVLQLHLPDTPVFEIMVAPFVAILLLWYLEWILQWNKREIGIGALHGRSFTLLRLLRVTIFIC